MPIDRASDYRRGKGRIKVATSKNRKGKLADGTGNKKGRLGEGYGERSKVAGSGGARLAGKGPNKQWVVKEKGASAIKKKGVMKGDMKPKGGNMGKNFKGAYGGK